MKSYIAPNWYEILTEQGLTNFESLWRLQLKLLDQPNTGRGRNGWSTACHFSLQMPGGIKKGLIIKRQKNHVSRTALHLLRGIPTLEKEARNAFRFKRLGIPVMEVVCYMRRKRADGTEAILVTEHLDGYMPLDKFEKEGIERHRLIEKIAAVVRMVHLRGLIHNSLYPKHIFIRKKNNEYEVRLIDLEKSKWFPFGDRRRVRDLKTLYKRSLGWSRIDRLRFIMAYNNVERLDENAKRLCQKILRKTKEKHAGV